MKYKVKYYETAIYTFEVEANDEDNALMVAHDVLLGSNDSEAAIRLVPLEGMDIACEVPEAEWDITEA